MATKAERFKTEEQKAAHGRRAPRQAQVSAGIRAARRGRRKDRLPSPTSHNEGARAARNGTYELEPGTTARPSRKSTRRSPTHIKNDSALRLAEMHRAASPQLRASRSTRNPI